MASKYIATVNLTDPTNPCVDIISREDGDQTNTTYTLTNSGTSSAEQSETQAASGQDGTELTWSVPVQDGTRGITGNRGPGFFTHTVTVTNGALPPPSVDSGTIFITTDDPSGVTFDTLARRIICSGQLGTIDSLTGFCNVATGNPINGDVFVLTYQDASDSTPAGTFTHSTLHDTSETIPWSEFELVIDGDLLVEGTIVAEKLIIDGATLESDGNGALQVGTINAENINADQITTEKLAAGAATFEKIDLNGPLVVETTGDGSITWGKSNANDTTTSGLFMGNANAFTIEPRFILGDSESFIHYDGEELYIVGATEEVEDNLEPQFITQSLNYTINPSFTKLVIELSGGGGGGVAGGTSSDNPNPGLETKVEILKRGNQVGGIRLYEPREGRLPQQRVLSEPFFGGLSEPITGNTDSIFLTVDPVEFLAEGQIDITTTSPSSSGTFFYNQKTETPEASTRTSVAVDGRTTPVTEVQVISIAGFETTGTLPNDSRIDVGVNLGVDGDRFEYNTATKTAFLTINNEVTIGGNIVITTTNDLSNDTTVLIDTVAVTAGTAIDVATEIADNLVISGFSVNRIDNVISILGTTSGNNFAISYDDSGITGGDGAFTFESSFKSTTARSIGFHNGDVIAESNVVVYSLTRNRLHDVTLGGTATSGQVVTLGLRLGNQLDNATYTTGPSDNLNDVANGLATAIDAIRNGLTGQNYSGTATGSVIRVDAIERNRYGYSVELVSSGSVTLTSDTIVTQSIGTHPVFTTGDASNTQLVGDIHEFTAAGGLAGSGTNGGASGSNGGTFDARLQTGDTRDTSAEGNFSGDGGVGGLNTDGLTTNNTINGFTGGNPEDPAFGDLGDVSAGGGGGADAGGNTGGNGGNFGTYLNVFGDGIGVGSEGAILRENIADTNAGYTIVSATDRIRITVGTGGAGGTSSSGDGSGGSGANGAVQIFGILTTGA